ncbi:Protein phosphatase 2C [Cnuella takakiae]|uniref:Protein phosphatase 2C n=1 Tax=Cnuella takakiae TaxID=1302690 RepID=A0A1M4VZ55_9BACT|nr:PP2C family serine/threonine-protein phosphatase [Cnuella takakiae]OLY92460.1 hypothetical protein BUE76_11610 [Cnuella takakiae]SHE74153.1 Protein phosphatase 2C [Cnuella takakiae]
MEDIIAVVDSLFRNRGIAITDDRKALFNSFLEAERNQALIDVIMQTGNLLMAGWKQEERIADLQQQLLRIPNATVGKDYTATLDFQKLGWQDMVQTAFSGLEAIGLAYDPATGQISGTPTQSGDIPLQFLYRLDTEKEDASLHAKSLTLTVNPDPKSLWKNLESDTQDPYWKEDHVTKFAPLGDRHIVVSSKRGRSHANVGSFREDDFAFDSLENGWQIVVVADGAGSAKLSRKGSALACASVVEYFKEEAAKTSMAGFDAVLQQYLAQQEAATEKELNNFVYNNLGKAAFTTHKKLEVFAKESGATLKDLSATLIFTLWKKYEAGYAFLSFGVGDCPIAVLNRDVTEVTLMNWLDVGEFGGGTRFITMPEIFQNKQFATRFGFKLIDDFSYLFLMSDGIYDPKFVVEAALPKISKWQEFLADLGGNNEAGTKVDLNPDNPEIAQQLSQWMDFWSPGNHDDRTLAIVF